MRTSLVAVLMVGLLTWLAPDTQRRVRAMFPKVAPSVVVIRAAAAT